MPAAPQNVGDSFFGRSCVVMAVEHVAVRVTVAGDVAVELPFAPQLVLQQPVVGAGWHAVDRVVAAAEKLFQHRQAVKRAAAARHWHAGQRTST